ncbi:TorF family putative porin [Noviluteimonas gilva]|uniref:Porin n=1 Tax=Noviluteimonas gilva TaxID=2682097 RepID=A0A7C9HNM1_9GAMM|nr:TorF family putative porin [Lysobacter gilvus]MUV15252.1 hypothetical protein [Lysobacter gilvus]
MVGTFRARETALPLVTSLCALALACSPARSEAADFSGNATLTSDYVWRGSTQTHGDPAVQAGFKVAGESGFYGSIWGSSVEFAPETHASSELDFTLGWSKALSNDWALDVNILRYQYPSTTVDLNWTELNSTLTYKNNYWASLGWSDEALGYDASGTYALVGAKFPVNDTVRFEAALAHYFLDDAVVAEDGYTHGSVSAVWTFHAPFEVRVTAHGTDSNAKRIFGDDFAGARIEAALQASF